MVSRYCPPTSTAAPTPKGLLFTVADNSDTLNAPAAWHEHAAALARAHKAPDPATDDYTWLVWALRQRRSGQLSPLQRIALDIHPEPVRDLHQQPWVQRFMECAARDAEGMALGGGERTAWLTAQRRARARGSLPAGRSALLERLSGFTWTPGADRWDSTMVRVADFALRKGRIPTRGDDPELSGWLAAQRFALRAGRLDAARIAALESIPGWSESLSSTRSQSVWEHRLAALRSFQAERGRYPRADATDPCEAAAGRWVSVQRELHRRGDLSRHRADALCAIPGWRWTAREADFDARADQLARELGGAPIDTGHRLYGWVVSQRRRHREGRLSPEQVDVLRSLNLLQDGLVSAA